MSLSNPSDVLAILQALAQLPGTQILQKQEAVGAALTILSNDTSASLTLLPGLLALLSESDPKLRVKLIQAFKSIAKTAANFEPTTSIAGTRIHCATHDKSLRLYWKDWHFWHQMKVLKCSRNL